MCHTCISFSVIRFSNNQANYLKSGGVSRLSSAACGIKQRKPTMLENKAFKIKKIINAGSIPYSICIIPKTITCLSVHINDESIAYFAYHFAESIVYLQVTESSKSANSLQTYFSKYGNRISALRFGSLKELRIVFYKSYDYKYGHLNNGSFNLVCSRLQVLDIANISRRGLIYLLDHTNSSWASVRTLKISLDNTLYLEQMDNAVQRQMAEMLKTSMPNIESLHLNASHSGVNSNSVFDQIANSYLRKIKRLDCNIPIKFTEAEMGDKLEHLDIVMEPNSKKSLPHVNAKNLIILKIKNVSSGFSWSSFDDAKTPGQVNFEKLRLLQLECSDDQSSAELCHKDSKSKFQINMDVVESVNLAAKSAIAGVIFADMHCAAKVAFRVTGPFALLSMLEKTRTDSAQSTDIVISKVSRHNEKQFYKCTNHVFSNIICKDKARLSLCKLPFTIQPGKTEWAFLHELRLEVSPEFDILVDLIWHLTNLEKLKIGIYQITENSARLSALTNSKPLDKAILPLSSSLNVLEISQIAEQNNTKTVITSISYLMIALPFLTKALVPSAVRDKLELFGQYTRVYPHVANIEMEIVDID